jgi:hypothetical protein
MVNRVGFSASIFQMQIESKFLSLAKPQLAWGSYKKAATYTLVKA